MKNGDMPANVLVSSTGVLWNLRDGHEDSQYLGQPNERFSFGLTKREQFAMAMAQGILANPRMIDNMDAGSIEWVAKRAASAADALLAELESAK